MKKSHYSNVTSVIVVAIILHEALTSTYLGYLAINKAVNGPSTPFFGPPMPGVDPSNEIPDRIDIPKFKKNLKNILKESEFPSEVKAYLPQLSGTRELLLILVDFSDVAGTKNDVYFENLMWGSRPSLRDYFLENSYNLYTYVAGKVLDPGADDTAPFYYTYPNTLSWAANYSNVRTVVTWAIQQADADFNFSPYDSDLNGIVTNEELTIVIVTSGVSGGMGGSAPWSHHWCTISPVITVDGVSVEGEYSITSEANPLGSFAHELGHDLGLPDLYDTNGGSEGIGKYGLMGSGSWCGPTHMTSWSKMQLGWIAPTIVMVDGYYDVYDVEGNAETYILYDPDYSTTEYFLVENRWRGTSYDSFIGLDGQLPDEGILIYHIDDVMAQDWWESGSNNVNQDEAHKTVDVECADSPTSHIADADDLDWELNRGDSYDLWDNTEYNFSDSSTPCNSTWYVKTPSGMMVGDFPAVGSTMRVYFYVGHPNTDPSVEWIHVYGVPGGMLDPGGTIERGGFVRMHSQVSDPETASQDLLVNVSYRVQGGDWTTKQATYKADKD
ncbi:MAG: M6 family metalloprotease domain-containing protein, partial [Candidatus Hodarchaeota archaeon]